MNAIGNFQMCVSDRWFEVVFSFGFMSWVTDVRPSLYCVIVVGVMFTLSKQNENTKKPQIIIRMGERDVENGCGFPISLFNQFCAFH